MGQGLYTMIAYGTPSPPRFTNDPDGEAYCEWTELRDLHVAYEAEPGYLAIALAVDDEALQHQWQLPELPDCIGPKPKPRTCVPAKVMGEVSPDFSRRVAVAEQQWLALQKELNDMGVALEDGRLLVVNDWN